MQLKGEHTLRQRRRQSIIKTQLTTNIFEGSFTCSPFCFYVECREFFWHQRTLFNTSRNRPPDHKGMASLFLSGSNFTCLIRVQPWTHRPIYSHIHSTTCWTQEITFNPFLHCPEQGQLRDVYTIIRQWGWVRGTHRQHHAPSRVDCKGPFIAAHSFSSDWILEHHKWWHKRVTWNKVK